MKQTLLFFFFILSISVSSQVEGPPAPCGYSGAYACDYDNDGKEQFNLKDMFPFSTFCKANNGEVEENYSEIVFYLTSEDLVNETNPINNPENFVNTSRTQVIFLRANAINNNAGFEYISHEDLIEILDPPSPKKPTALVACDTDENGVNTFKLSDKNEEILAGLDSKVYEVNYFDTLLDAQNNINPLSDNYTNTSNPQTVYSRVHNMVSPSSCFEVVEVELKVEDMCNDVSVYLISESSPRPGFSSTYHLKVKNLGTNENVSGSVEFTKDILVDLESVYFVSAESSVVNTTSGFVLNFSNLEPGSLGMVSFKLHVPVSVGLGTKIINSAAYGVGDINLRNNISTLTETVIGSYDPNDIMESHGPEILYDDFTSEDYLYYTIRFQNVGTADAINVSIDNTLNARLDKSSIQMLASSHDYVFTRTNNQLNWQFDNIHLPSEQMDEPNSHGYVYYKIKPLSGYGVGDIIPNTAEIYFDFNEAVVTNTFETEFVEPETLSNARFGNTKFLLNPNPAKKHFYLQLNEAANSGLVKVSIVDLQGKEILKTEKNNSGQSIKLDISQLKSGLYFVRVMSGSATLVGKLVVE